MENTFCTLPIEIVKMSDCPAVDARELHAYLEVGTEFKAWIRRRIEKFDFVEGEDFEVIVKNDDRFPDSYIISLDMAKELAMVENNKLGKEARKYFIHVEKEYKNGAKNPAMLPNFSNPAEAARAWADQFDARQLAEKTVAIQKPKVDYYEKALSSTSLFTTNSIGMCIGLSAVKLNLKLQLAGVQHKQGGLWLLTAKYRDKGLARVIDVPLDSKSGEVFSKPQLKWTEKGKEFIIALHNNGEL